MQAIRLFGFAAVRLKGVCAGTIDSKKGKAMVTPAPRRNVRRLRCFLVTNVMSASWKDGLGAHFHLHLKWCAFCDAENKRRKTIVAAGSIADDRPDHRHVVVADGPAQGIRQKFFSRVRNKRIRPAD